jgi:tetratricopeptide (TPR) repeat protein
MKTVKLSFLLIIGAVFLSGTAADKQLTLAKGGKTSYTIVTPNNPSPVEATAAKELQQYFNAITGANIAIVKESAAKKNKPQIVVGNSARARELVPGLNADKLPYDGIVISTTGNHIVLVGHPVRGTLYAVNTFLEEACGVRWWTSTEQYVPVVKTLKAPSLNINYAPKLIYREAFYKDVYSSDVNFRNEYYKDVQSDIFAVRMKNNGYFTDIRPEFGGYHKFQYFVHSFFPILPPEKYFDKHPEWYSQIDGKRKHEYTQLCLTNEQMQAEFIKNALDSLRQHPDMDFISVSQNDCHGACQCDKCQAVVKEEGGESGPLIRFVNIVAEAIEKEFPDIWVETLAYQYTRKAPLKVKPRKNVVVRLCTIECSFSQPLGEGEQNKLLRDDIEAWSNIADNLFVWNYVTNFSSYMLPHPNIQTLAPNVRFFIKNNTIGLFEQGDVYCDAGDFVRMRNWVISHLLWNPNLDENKLIDQFLTGYYGEKAAPYLRQYWDLLAKNVIESGVYLRCYMGNTAGWLTVPAYAEALSLFKQAIAATNDEVYLQRLRREEIPIKYVLLLENERFREYEKQNGNLPFTLTEPEKALNEFIKLLKDNNVTMIREDFSPAPNHIRSMEQNLRKALLLP